MLSFPFILQSDAKLQFQTLVGILQALKLPSFQARIGILQSLKLSSFCDNLILIVAEPQAILESIHLILLLGPFTFCE